MRWRGIFGALEWMFGQFSDTSLDAQERKGSWGATLLLVSQVPAWFLALSIASVLWGVTLGIVDAKSLQILKLLVNWPTVVVTLAPAVIGLVCHILRKKDDRQAMLELGSMVVQLRGTGSTATSTTNVATIVETQLSNAVANVTKTTVDIPIIKTPDKLPDEGSGRT